MCLNCCCDVGGQCEVSIWWPIGSLPKKCLIMAKQSVDGGMKCLDVGHNDHPQLEFSIWYKSAPVFSSYHHQFQLDQTSLSAFSKGWLFLVNGMTTFPKVRMINILIKGNGFDSDLRMLTRVALSNLGVR